VGYSKGKEMRRGGRRTKSDGKEEKEVK